MSYLVLFFFLFTPNPEIIKGIDAGYEERYAQAESIFIGIKQREPDNPAPCFFLSSLYATYMSDFCTDSLKEKFFTCVDTTLKKSNKFPDNAWAYVYKGGALVDRAFYKYEKGDYLGALSDGSEAVSHLNTALRIDSTIYDAYIGLGVYDYIKYRISNIVPLVNGNDKWIKELELASDSAYYLRIAAMNTLALLCIEEKRFTKALNVTNYILKQYPRSRTFRWTQAKLFERKADWEMAEKVYRELLWLILEGQPHNLYNILYIREKLADIYLKRGKLLLARREANKMIKLAGNDSDFEKFKKRAERLLKETGE